VIRTVWVLALAIWLLVGLTATATASDPTPGGPRRHLEN
jgi:hypothetical protein